MKNTQIRVDTNHVSMWVEHGIMNVIWKGSCISIEAAELTVKHRLELSAGNTYPLYVDIRSIISIDSKARKYLSSELGTCQALAAALHVNNPVGKFIGKLFIITNNPIKPTELFMDKNKALKWLERFKKP
jgi:hypothetical protein